MVLINHNDVHWSRIAVRPGEELHNADCQIYDKVCKLFHSLHSHMYIVLGSKMITHFMPKVTYSLFSSHYLAVYTHFY